MKLLHASSLLVVFIILVTSRVAIAEPFPQQYYGGPGGQVSGVVWSIQRGAPIDWAIIRARNAQHEFQAASGMSGFYLLRLPNGTYTITVEASGYDAASVNVTVSDGSSSTVNFYLNPQQTSTPVPEFQSSEVLIAMALVLVAILLHKQKTQRTP